jgi:hypothetical protein
VVYVRRSIQLVDGGDQIDATIPFRSSYFDPSIEQRVHQPVPPNNLYDLYFAVHSGLANHLRPMTITTESSRFELGLSRLMGRPAYRAG